MSQWSYYALSRTEVCRFLPKSYSRVLEIGCGEGEFGGNLNAFVELWGVEPNDISAKNAINKNYKILIGTFDQVASKLPDFYFDLVVCNDVIEHMVNHEEFLVKIQGKMKQDACMVGSVPNVRYLKNLYNLLIKKDWEYVGSGILDATHLRFFTQRSLSRSLLRSGFLIESLSGINGLVRKPNSFENFLKMTLGLVICVGTLGFYRDTTYMQFGFRVRRQKLINPPDFGIAADRLTKEVDG